MPSFRFLCCAPSVAAVLVARRFPVSCGLFYPVSRQCGTSGSLYFGVDCIGKVTVFPRKLRRTSPPRRAACSSRTSYPADSVGAFVLTSPLRRPLRFWHLTGPRTSRIRSFRFCPPRRLRASQAEISSLLRVHLPPRTPSVHPRVSAWHVPCSFLETLCGASPVTAPVPCILHRPQSRHELEQVSDVALFCRLVGSCRRIRFAFAACRMPPIASFRPRRCQRRPCDSD